MNAPRAAPTLLAAALAILAGCATRPSQERDAQPLASEPAPSETDRALLAQALLALTPATDAVFVLDDAVPAPVALPIEPPNAPAIAAAQAAGVRLVRIAGRPRAPSQGWIPPLDWTVRDAVATTDVASDAGAWFALLPHDSLIGQTALSIGNAGASLPIRRAAAATPRGNDDDRAGQLALAALDPRTRWRVALHRSLAHDARRLPHFDEPALESYSRAIEARVRVALLRLGAHDPAQARELTRTLSRVVVFDAIGEVPAFTPDDDALNDVLSVLLDERVPIVVGADRTLQYLASQPRALAWIIDDAGGTAFSDAESGAIGVAELAGQSDLVRVSPSPVASCDPPTLDALLAHRVTIAALRCRESPAVRTIEVATGAGQWSSRLDATLAPAPASPPGLRIGPLLPQHTMRSWLSSGVNQHDPRWATAALLSRRAGASSWQIYLECLADRSHPTTDPAQPDEVRFFIGPSRSPRAVITVRADATATITTRSATLGDSQSPLTPVVRHEDDRWIAFLDLPDGLLEPDGTLLLGAERTDPRRVRTTWPRPVFPWDDAAPRLRIDLSSWAPQTRRAD